MSALTEDLPLNGCPAWNIVLKSADPNQKSRAGFVLLQSQLWPGAYALAKSGGRWNSNMYVGWGIKYEGGQGFSPVTISQPMSEYVAGKDTQEVDDPSIEDEIAQKY